MDGQSDARTQQGLELRAGLLNGLLACGIVSSLLYVATDLLAAARWEGYRIVDRMASDLFAVGSPTRSFIVRPMIAYNLLVIAFGVGVWLSAREKRSLRVTGVLLIAYGVASWMGLVLFPLRPDSSTSAGGEMALSGILHASITGVLVLLMFLFIGFGAAALGKGFRLYSVATILLVLLGGVLSFAQVQRVAEGLPTPWLGVVERMNIYAALLWVVVFAVMVMRANREYASAAIGDRVGSARPKKKATVLLGSPHRRALGRHGMERGMNRESVGRL